jgi:hypothetical protein
LVIWPRTTLAPVVAGGVGQVHGQALIPEKIHRPIPAIGGLDDHLWACSVLEDGLEESLRIVGDALAAEPVAFGVHREDDRAAAMEVDSYVVSHWGLLLFVERFGLWKPRVSYGRSDLSRGAEAPLLHHITYRVVPTSCPD